MKPVSIDIETYSSVHLAKRGVYKYTEAIDFDILLFGYSADDDPVQVVDLACGNTIPPAVIAALINDGVRNGPLTLSSRESGFPTSFGIMVLLIIPATAYRKIPSAIISIRQHGNAP